MAKNQLAIPRYRVILRTLARDGLHASKDIHVACINCGIEVTLRTIQNDLKTLRDESVFGKNLNIIFDEKSKKWYSEGIPKEIFSALELQDGEVDALLFYAKAINQYSDYPIFKDISQAMKKVVESSNISEDRKRLFNLENLIDAEKHPPIAGIEFIADLLTAISDKKIIKLEYEPFGRDIKGYRIKPILLKEDKLMWYLIGVNIKYDRLITFALDRVKNILITGEDFEKIEFNSSEYFKNSFGITVSDEAPIEVVISFELKQAFYLKTLPIHPTQEIVKETKNQLTIKVNVKPSYEFFSKIRSYGSGATVITPKSIRDIFIKDFKQVKSNYKLK